MMFIKVHRYTRKQIIRAAQKGLPFIANDALEVQPKQLFRDCCFFFANHFLFRLIIIRQSPHILKYQNNNIRFPRNWKLALCQALPLSPKNYL